MSDVHPFRSAVESGNLYEALALLHDDIEFRSPVVFGPYHGKAQAAHLLRHVAEVFSDFEYVDETRSGASATLVFHAKVGNREVEGIDYLVVDEDGMVTQLAVFVRPMSGLIALAEAMQTRLAADPLPA